MDCERALKRGRVGLESSRQRAGEQEKPEGSRLRAGRAVRAETAGELDCEDPTPEMRRVERLAAAG